MLNRDHTIRYANAAAESLFGLSRKQLIDNAPAHHVPDLEPLNSLIDRSFENGRTFGRTLTITIPQRDFMTIEMICRVSRLTDNGNGPVAVEMLDSTHWRQLDKEKLLLAQREASRMIIRQLAHEIRNPLGGLRGAAQLLERQLQDPDLAEYTRVIIGEADRLTALTESLLGPKSEVKLETVNIHELTEHVLLLIENDAPKGVSIRRDYDPSLPPTSLDRDQIIQAFLNIARNAIQALGDSGTLTVRTRVLTNVVIGPERHRLSLGIDFEDNGPGISADIVDSIFYPLVTDRETGTGLGLPLAQDLVSRHGGIIEFDSEPGRTCFHIVLPIPETEPPE